jgi:branched-chain amino acid transport system permease protein
MNPDRPSIQRWLLAVWILCLASPFVFVRINYDTGARQLVAGWNTERIQFILTGLPGWLRERWDGILIFAAIVAGALALAKLWQRSGWANYTESVSSRTRRNGIVAGIVAAAVLPVFLSDKYLGLAIFTGLYMILAMGLNLTVGMTGLLVLGYAAFYAIGAYTFGVMHLKWGVPFYAALLPALVTGAAMGFLVGLPSIRLRGDYLAIVTLGFGETVRFVLKNTPGLTNGDLGIAISQAGKIPKLPDLVIFPLARSGEQTAYYVVLALLLLSLWLVRNLVNSRIGRAWMAIREDETAARAMGINTVRMKVMAFVFSAMWASVAGVIYVAREGYVEPDIFRFDESVLILSMVILGGMGSGPGPLLGAAVLYLVPQILRDEFPALLDYRLMIFGAVMIVMMIWRPQGLLGSVRRRIEIEEQPT